MNLPHGCRETFLEAVSELRASGKPVAIFGHLRPDGDCVGAQIALCRYLRAQGVDAACVNTHDVPQNLKWLVGDTPFFKADAWENKGHLAVYVDCSTRERIGEELAARFDGVFLAIDHHRSNGGFAERDIVVPEKAATCEILAELLLEQNAVDAQIARALYVGIATDTGQFQYPSTTARTFELARLLTERGADPSVAARMLYNQNAPGKLRLLGIFLDSLKVEENGRICVGFLRLRDFLKTQTTREDAENFVDYPRSLASVQISAVVEEISIGVKVSLRARSNALRVDVLAVEFGGGGHAAASGFTAKGETIESFYPVLRDRLRAHLAQFSK